MKQRARRGSHADFFLPMPPNLEKFPTTASKTNGLPPRQRSVEQIESLNESEIKVDNLKLFDPTTASPPKGLFMDPQKRQKGIRSLNIEELELRAVLQLMESKLK